MRNKIKGSVRVLLNGCWLWVRGIRGDGYPAVCYNGKQEGGHRVSFAVFNNSGVLPDLHVLHRCDRPLCVNPDHLFLGTVQDNMRDCAKKGRKKGERNANSKLVEAEVRHIGFKYRAAKKGAWGGAAKECLLLAQSYGVAEVTIQKIVQGAIWGHISGVRLVRRCK